MDGAYNKCNRQIFRRIKQPPSQYAAILGWRSITLLHFACLACLRRQSGQELGNPVLVNLAQARCAFQNPQQVPVGIQIVLLSRFNQAVDHSTGLCAGRSIGKQPVLPAHHKRLYTAFSTVVAQFQSAVFQISNEIWPLLFQIVQRFAKRGFRCCPGDQIICPCQ